MSDGGRSAEIGHKGIRDVAKQLGVTQRTLRFYEDKGLISPARVGNTRIYSRRDVGRMQLILRGKRLGFTIREIREFLDLYDVDADHLVQMDALLDQVRGRLIDLEKQRIALEETIGELRTIEKDTMQRLVQGRQKATLASTPSAAVNAR